MKKEEIEEKYFKLKSDFFEKRRVFNELKRSGSYDIEDLLDAHQDFIIAQMEFIKFKEQYGHLIVVER